MEPLFLHAQNFCTLGDVKLSLDRAGLILVLGDNRDAPKASNNGAGKSTLFDAICWCLWGETPRGLSGDDVINLATGKDCMVAFSFREGADVYKVVRHRKDTRVNKPNDVLVYKNDEQLASRSSMKTMQEVIDRIVGFDFHTFCAMMPGTGVKATNMTDAQIKQLLERLLRTEQLAGAYEAARARAKELDNLLSTNAMDEQRALNELKTLVDELQQLRTLRDSFEENKKLEIRSLKKRLAELDAEIKEFDSQISAKNDLMIERRNVEVTLNQIDLKKAEEEARTKEEQRRISLDLDRIRSSISTLSSCISTLEKEVRNIEALGPTCSSCKQAIPDVHKQEQISSRQNEIESYKEQRNKFELSLQEKLLASEQLEKTLRSFVQELGKQRTLETAKLTEIDKQLKAIATQEALRSRVVSERQRVNETLTKTKNKTADFEPLISAKEKRQSEIQEELERLSQFSSSLENEKKLCDFWVNGFSPAGLRSFMLDYVTPILNDRAAHYAELLTGGEMEVRFTTKTKLKSGEVRDKFQIQVKQKHGANSYKATSTGERARADLVVCMALGDLAALRTAKQLPWRFLDEPFESIDDAGIDAIVKLLSEQKDRYKTVFVVTHKSSLKQLLSTQQITVVKENGISRLEQ